MNAKKIYQLSSILIKSQLRSGRSGAVRARLSGRPREVFAIDAALFAILAGLVYFIMGMIGSLSPDTSRLLDALIRGALTSMPTLVASFVLVTAVMFELSVSSKFASSDVVNWLPVSQTEYVTASTISVSYIYSWLPVSALGITLPLASQFNLVPAWELSAVLSIVALFTIGALVEIMRAAFNRVTSAVYGKAGRGTIVIRLAIVVVVILAVQLGVNPTILTGLIGTFTGIVNTAFFFPFFWPSASVSYFINGATLLSASFLGLSVIFTFIVLLAAVAARSRYWSPVPVTIEVTRTMYAPGTGFLQSFGLSAKEAAIVRKDLKGYTRRRELISYLALPVVFVALLVFQRISTGPTPVTTYWLLGGLVAVIVAATSVGQEGKAILNIYASPVTPRSFLRAKVLVSSLLGGTTVLALVVVSSILESATLVGFLSALVVSVLIAIECTLIGIGVSARFPDLQERPRPRFVTPKGMLIAMIVGIFLAIITAVPIVFWQFIGGYFEAFGLSFSAALAIVTVFGATVSVAAYRWAISSVSKLMTELPV